MLSSFFEIIGRIIVGSIIGGFVGYKTTSMIESNPGSPLGGIGKGVLQLFGIVGGGIISGIFVFMI